MSTAFEITADRDSILIRVDRKSTDEEALTKLLDYLEMETIRRRSKLTEEQASQLASEVKGAAWRLVKHLFVEQ